jgi:hypothetical protein
MPILRILCYNGSLATLTVVSLTATKFKPLTFSMSGFAGTGPSSYKERIYRAAVSQRLKTTGLYVVKV